MFNETCSKESFFYLFTYNFFPYDTTHSFKRDTINGSVVFFRSMCLRERIIVPLFLRSLVYFRTLVYFGPLYVYSGCRQSRGGCQSTRGLPWSTWVPWSTSAPPLPKSAEVCKMYLANALIKRYDYTLPVCDWDEYGQVFQSS